MPGVDAYVAVHIIRAPAHMIIRTRAHMIRAPARTYNTAAPAAAADEAAANQRAAVVGEAAGAESASVGPAVEAADATYVCRPVVADVSTRAACCSPQVLALKTSPCTKACGRLPVR